MSATSLFQRRPRKGHPVFLGWLLSLAGRAWYFRVTTRDRDVLGFGGGERYWDWEEDEGRKGDGSAGGRPPSPPGKWANEKHTLAGTVFTREFNYPVFRSRCFPFVFGVDFFSQLTERPRPFNLSLKNSKG